MDIEAISYEYGSPGNPYGGRIALQLFADERFVASYHHRNLVKRWEGRVTVGTFAIACDALSSAGIPDTPRLSGLAPGEYPLELGWLRDGNWQRGETTDDTRYSKVEILASTILSVLDSNLARMPPGETTPVIEHRQVEAPR